MKIIKFFQKNWGYTKQQAYASASFMVFTFFLVSGVLIYKFFKTEKKEESIPKEKVEEIINLENENEQKNISASKLEKTEKVEIIPYTKKIIKKEAKKFSIDINSAEKIDLIKIKGIGNKIGERIIKFREKLGGFVSINQIDSVFGIDKKNLKSIKNNLLISENFTPKKIKINHFSFKEILSHPYISYESTKKIFNYRKKKPIENFDELKKLLTEDDFKNFDYLQHYIEF